MSVVADWPWPGSGSSPAPTRWLARMNQMATGMPGKPPVRADAHVRWREGLGGGGELRVLCSRGHIVKFIDESQHQARVVCATSI